MNKYFRKKYFFSIVFFVIIISVSVLSILENGNSIVDEVDNELRNVKSLAGIKGAIGRIEQIANSNIAVEDNLTEVYGSFYKLMAKKETIDFRYVKDAAGNLYSGAFYVEQEKELFEYAKRVRRLKEAIEPLGTKTLYIAYPEKDWICSSIMNGLPIRNYSYAYNEFLFDLMLNRVDSLDLIQSFHNMTVDIDKLYYRTDKSLNNYGSFQAFRAIVLEINSRYKENLDKEGYYTDVNNYCIRTYEDSFLGNMGREVGTVYAGTDDFELYEPKNRISFLWNYMDKKKAKHSVEGNITLSAQHEISANNIYHRHMKSVYLNKCNDLDVITNKDNGDGPKILCIRDDNFSNIAIYLAQVCSELHLIDASSRTTRIEDYVKDNQFDYVLICISTSRLKDTYFNYYK